MRPRKNKKRVIKIEKRERKKKIDKEENEEWMRNFFKGEMKGKGKW